MEIFIPKYYQDFHCIAAACPDSCCKEWEVDVDETAAAFYRALPGSLGEDLRQVLKDTETGTVMTIREGRCPMWQQDGLCRIQAELGHDALCQVCQQFPRLSHDYGDFIEYGLELSCPEAARLILTESHTMTVQTQPDADPPEYDREAMTLLQKSRRDVFDFLDTTPLPANLALAVLLLYAHEAQSWLDGGEAPVLDSNANLALAKKYAVKGDWQQLVSFFLDLEILTPQWRTRLEQPFGDGDWHFGYLTLARYFMERYWLQTVSDYDLIGRVKLAIAACLLVYHLGGEFIETAQLFSKEIENNSDNLDAILDGAYTSPALTDVQLLSLLVNG